LLKKRKSRKNNTFIKGRSIYVAVVLVIVELAAPAVENVIGGGGAAAVEAAAAVVVVSYLSATKVVVVALEAFGKSSSMWLSNSISVHENTVSQFHNNLTTYCPSEKAEHRRRVKSTNKL
jgi:hypothetical protein